MTATPVAPLSPSVEASCPICEAPATWAVGPSERSCDDHLGYLLTDLYRADPVLPVIGPLAHAPGRHDLGPTRCGCAATYGESCPECDGTARDARDMAGRLTRADRAQLDREARAPVPPCMRPTYAEEAS